MLSSPEEFQALLAQRLPLPPEDGGVAFSTLSTKAAERRVISGTWGPYEISPPFSAHSRASHMAGRPCSAASAMICRRQVLNIAADKRITALAPVRCMAASPPEARPVTAAALSPAAKPRVRCLPRILAEGSRCVAEDSPWHGFFDAVMALLVGLSLTPLRRPAPTATGMSVQVHTGLQFQDGLGGSILTERFVCHRHKELSHQDNSAYRE
jgi:hypothetical protein